MLQAPLRTVTLTTLEALRKGDPDYTSHEDGCGVDLFGERVHELLHDPKVDVADDHGNLDVRHETKPFYEDAHELLW